MPGSVPTAGQRCPDLADSDRLPTLRDESRPSFRNFHISHVADVYLSSLVTIEMSGDRMPPPMQVADSVVVCQFQKGPGEGKLDVVIGG